MGDTPTRAVLKPVKRFNYWRVEMTWQEYRRYVGKFASQAEAEKWIAEHQWLTKQTDEKPKHSSMP
jgi:hypothetical protein